MREKIRLHMATELTGKTIETDRHELCVLSLSNGAGLAIGPSTRVHVVTYKQRPFTAAKHSLGYEPSVSRLELTLESGSVAVAAERLSPLSQVNVHYPLGMAKTHSGNVLFRYDATGAHLASFEGNATYTYPETTGREFITTPQGIRISDQSAQLQEIVQRYEIDDIPATLTVLIATAKNSSRRVIYKVAGDQPAIPKPLYIAREAQFKVRATQPDAPVD